MFPKSVFCIASSRQQAAIVRELLDSGFTHEDISVLASDDAATQQAAGETNAKALEVAVTGASTGGVVGGVLGWIVGVGALFLPGVGPPTAAGPRTGMGIPTPEAKRLEGREQAGYVLISVLTGNDAEIEHAQQIYEQAGAEGIFTRQEAPSQKASGADYRCAPVAPWKTNPAAECSTSRKPLHSIQPTEPS